MRIAGGRWRGKRLLVPPGVRPTGARVREALFSIWSARIAGASFLDLFAGSGAVGLEALSRGAAQVTFVERRGRAARVLRQNCARLAHSNPSVIELTLPTGLAGRLPLQLYDLVYCDPPYAFDRREVLPAMIEEVLAADGEVALEHDVRRPLGADLAGLTIVSERAYGDAVLTLLRRPRD